jgi:hypothetical protein
MLPLYLAVFAVVSLLLWTDRSCRRTRAKKLVETSEPLELSVWPCEIDGEICVDFSRATNIKPTEKRKYPKCYPLRLTSHQRQRFSSVRSKILSVKVFNPTRVWIDPETEEPCAIHVEDEIFWLNS